MSDLEALLLGVVQGLTEFLPISSSGHLIIVPWLQDYDFLVENPSFNKTFDVALHIGTLIAVVTYFRAELTRLAAAFLRTLRKRSAEGPDERLSWAIAIGTVPAVIVGGLGGDWIDVNLGQPWMIAIELMVFGVVLAHADRSRQRLTMKEMPIAYGLWIGIAQAVSLAPGASRSGVTISMARYLHLDRDSAARFSFLLLVPATAGAALYKAYEAVSEGLPAGVARPMVVGTIAAGISGYAAIAWLLRLVRTRSYDVFVVYRLIAGFVILGLIATGLRDASF